MKEGASFSRLLDDGWNRQAPGVSLRIFRSGRAMNPEAK